MKGDGYGVKTLSCWFVWRSGESRGKCLHNVIGFSDVAESTNEASSPPTTPSLSGQRQCFEIE